MIQLAGLKSLYFSFYDLRKRFTYIHIAVYPDLCPAPHETTNIVYSHHCHLLQTTESSIEGLCFLGVQRKAKNKRIEYDIIESRNRINQESNGCRTVHF